MQNFFDRLFESKTKVILGLVLPAFVLYFKSIHFDFTSLDEQWMIVKNESLPQGRKALTEAFTTSISGTYYRPFLLVSFFMDYCIGRLSPYTYHFTNLMLHLACVLLLFRFLCLNKVPQKAAFIYSLIFSVHPVMLHAVAWVPGRNDLLLCLFTLASLNALLKFFETPDKKIFAFHLLFFAGALLTKESAVVLPLIFAVYYTLYKTSRSKELLYFSGAWLALVVLWLLVRSRTVFISPGDVAFSLNALKEFVPAMLLYMGKAIVPVQQSVLPMLRDASLIPGLLVLALLVISLYRPGVANKKLAAIGLLLFFVLLAIPVWFSVAKSGAEHYEHRIYTSMAGLFLFFSQLKFSTSSRLFYYVATAVLCVFAVRTYSRINVYSNQEHFLNAGVKESPDFYLFQFQVGELMEQKGKYDSAFIYYNRAIALRPDKGQLYSNRGAALYSLGFVKESISDFTKAIDLSPGMDYRYHLNRCIACSRIDRMEQAMRDLYLLKTCCQSVIPPEVEKKVTDRWALMMQGLNRRLQADPLNDRLYFKRANLLFDTGWNPEAIADLRKACELAPENTHYQQALKAHTGKVNF